MTQVRGGRWTAVGHGHPREGAWTRLRGAIPIRLGMALLAAGLLVICCVRPAATAADPQPDVKITLTKLAPSVVTPDSTVVFEGRVKNTSDRPLHRLQASIWRSLVPMTSRPQLKRANQSSPGNPMGQRMYRQPHASADLFTKSKPNLAPGKSVRFRVRAKATGLLRTPDPNNGIYLAGIQVRENGQTVGQARTYLPVQSKHAVRHWKKSGTARKSRVKSATLVKLTATPTMARSGVFVDDSLARQVSAGGRLDKLLSAAAKSQVSYAVDPNLIAELGAMRDGYRVVDRDGTASSGSGASAAKSWLDRFAKMQDSHDGYRIPYAQPDLAALLRNHPKADTKKIIKDAQQASRQISATKDLPLLIAPPRGAASQRLLALADKLNAAAVLLSSDTVRGDGTVLGTRHGPTIVTSDSGAHAGPGPAPRDTPVQQRQTWLATAYADAANHPRNSSHRARLQVIDNAAGTKNIRPTAPWIARSSLADLLDLKPRQLNSKPSYPARARRAELSTKQLGRVARMRRGVHIYRQLLADPKDVDRTVQQMFPRSVSSSWRGHTKAMRRFRSEQTQMLKTANGDVASLSQLRHGDLIHIESNPQVTLTGASGTIPVTIVNKLDVAIKVGVRARSSNDSRLAVQSLSGDKLGAIKAGSHRPAQIPADASSNGTLQITLQLTNADSETIGQKLPVQVNATRAGMIGWVIVIGAGIVLLGTVALRVRQVRRERSSHDQPGPDDESSQGG